MESFESIMDKKPQLVEEQEGGQLPAGIFYDQALGKQLLRSQHANQVKLKIKKLIAKIDSKSQGIVNRRVFFDILDLHEVRIAGSDKKQLCKFYGCDREGKYATTSQCVIGESIDKEKIGAAGQCEFIKYKDALSMIYIDLNSNEEKWILRQGGNHYLTQARLNQLSRMSQSKLCRLSHSSIKKNELTDKRSLLNQSIVVTSSSNLLKKFNTSNQDIIMENDPYNNLGTNNSLKKLSRNKLRNASLSLGLKREELQSQALQCSDKYDQYRQNYMQSLSSAEIKGKYPRKNIETVVKDEKEMQGKRRYRERTYNYGSVDYDPLAIPNNKSDVSFISLECGGLSKAEAIDHRVQRLRSSATDSFLQNLLVNQYTGQLKKVLTSLSYKLQSLQVDPRIFNNMKAALFGLERTFISEQEFYEVFMSHFKQSIKSTFIYDLVLAQIKTESQEGDVSSQVSVYKLLALIDFYSFLPSKLTQVNPALNNSSLEMVQVLQQPLQQPIDDLDPLLSLIELKMKERFSTTAGCFRAFDRSQTGEINLPEFQHALETLLKVKIATQDSEKVFKWLDTRACGVIDFRDFSRINCGIINEIATAKGNLKMPQHQASMPLLTLTKTSIMKQQIAKPQQVVQKQQMNTDLEHLNQTSTSSFQTLPQRRSHSTLNLGGGNQISSSLNRLGDILRNKKPIVTVNDSQSMYGVSVHQRLNPVTLNKFLQTQKEGNTNSSHEFSSFSIKTQNPAQHESNSQVRLMPMKNILIQEYYDNKKSMLKLGTATKYSTSKLY